MKFLNYITEDYATRDGKWEIFVNPSFDEIIEVRKTGGEPWVRFIADFEKKRLFVFALSFLHKDAIRVLKRMPIYSGMQQIVDLERGVEAIVKNKGYQSYALGTAGIQRGTKKMEFIDSDPGRALVEVRDDTDKSINYLDKWKWIHEDDSWLNTWFSKPFIKTYIEVLNKPSDSRALL